MLRIVIKAGETPEEAMMRYAEFYGLERDVEEAFARYTSNGLSAEEAAFCALLDWDLLDYVDAV